MAAKWTFWLEPSIPFKTQNVNFVVSAWAAEEEDVTRPPSPRARGSAVERHGQWRRNRPSTSTYFEPSQAGQQKKKLPDDKWTRTQRPTPRFVWRALLQHPNLSVAHDVFTKPQSPRITQDSTVCCDSISWSKAIKKKRISTRETGDTVATSERGRQRKQTKETSRHARCPLEAAVAATISKL